MGKVTGEGVEWQGVSDDDNGDDVMAMFLHTSHCHCCVANE